MPQVQGEIPSFINGVSQQSAPMRLPTQGEEQLNYYSTLVGGLKKRPPTEVVARIAESVPPDAFFHIIDRDANEKYVAVFTASSVQVFDFAGNPRTVTTPSGLGYLSSPDLRFLTVADYTMVVNRNKTVAMDTARAPVRPFEAVINVSAGNYARTYEIRVNGSVVASFTTPDGSAASQGPQIATTNIAAELYSDLLAAGFSSYPWAVGIHQNALHIVNYLTDFSIAGSDGVNGNAMKINKDRIARFTDLPQYGPDGFVIEITGSSGTSYDNYWVRADKGGTNNNSVITWRETVKPNTVLGLDAATMPHALQKQPDGTFIFGPLTWDSRKAGDDTRVSPNPSFVDQKIMDVFFHRNRLGLLADENVVLSRSGSFFDFFRTSATALLDDDPIDISSAHIKVSFLRAAVPTSESLFLFSDRSQFRLSQGDLLTAKTVAIKPIAEFTTSPDCRPIAVGNVIYFAGSNVGSDYASIFEMSFDKRTEQVLSSEITAHIPNYIPTVVKQITGSVDESVLAIRSDADPDSIFIYRYYWSGDEKVQSSISKWTFPGVTILHCLLYDSELLLLVNRGGRLVLERVRMDTAATDPGYDFIINLDGRSEATGGAYDADSNTTAFVVPLVDPAVPLTCVLVSGDRAMTAYTATIGSRTGGLAWNVTVSGNHTGSSAVFGVPYSSTYELSPLFYRVANGQSQRAIQEGRLQVKTLSLSFQDTSFFNVRLIRPDRADTLIQFNGQLLQDQTTIIGSLPISSGSKTVTIEAESRRVRISLENDTWKPCSFLSASWRGHWSGNNRRG
jgi:hypothetical protein